VEPLEPKSANVAVEVVRPMNITALAGAALPMRRAPLLIALCLACGGGIGSGGSAPPIGQVQQGIATYYETANGGGACSFDPSPDDLDVAAMNAEQWGGSGVCGACATVVGPKGSVVVRIVDLCPECKKGHLDLSPQAFEKVADLVKGRVDITWQLRACAVSGKVRYQIKDGSSQWWTAIQVRDHRLPISSLAYQKDGAWVDLPRETYNYFVAQKGVGPGAFRVRITAWDGQTLEDELPGPNAEAVYEGTGQFQ
jgi:expansin (peptidoglycan-binding protein)